jgi:hypothetical protein
LICMLYTNLYAQVDTLSVADTSGSPGSTNNLLDIELNNTVGIAGVQFTLTFDGSLLTATSADVTTRTSHMSIGYSSWVDSIKILMYSMTGDSISPSKGSIIGILFDIDSSAVACDSTLLHLKDVTLSDTHAQPISVNIVDGWFHFVSVGVKEFSKAENNPSTYKLRGNVPNPFTLKTTIYYYLPVKSDVSLKVFSFTGRLVRILVGENKGAGYHTISWDGRDDKGKKVASGIYFCKLETSRYSAIKKMILLR